MHSSDSLITAFYNVENLFDTIDDPLKNDEDFLPGSDRQWTDYRYMDKLENISASIASIHPGKMPAIIGLSEIENRGVLQDLTAQTVFKGSYDIVHFDSPDRRGIDVALLYDKQVFKVQSAENIPVRIESNSEFATRDILYVKGTFGKEQSVHFFVNHWPSRREGTELSMPRRIAAAKELYKKVLSILNDDAQAKILIMGDFNDLPVSKSLSVYLNSRKNQNIEFNELYNLAFIPHRKKIGSLYARGKWLMFDQMLISRGMMHGDGIKIKSSRLTVHYDKKLLFYDKKNSIYRPSRTYSGKRYHGGFSDHLPVYVYMSME